MAGKLLRLRTLASRVARDPALVRDVADSLYARVSDRRRATRVPEYARVATPMPTALSKLLTTDENAIEDTTAAPSFRRLLEELASYRKPAEASGMGGPAFVEACYAFVRLVRPSVAIETGVAHGYSTAAILQAMEDNGMGRLYSIDLPVFRPGAPAHTGGAIPARLRDTSRWELLVGTDRRILPSLLKRTGQVDFFMYDSDKSYSGMRRTWKRAWPHLAPGGILLSDDVEPHDAFLDFADSVSVEPMVMAKPRRQMNYRWDKTYYVGALKKPA